MLSIDIFLFDDADVALVKFGIAELARKGTCRLSPVPLLPWKVHFILCAELEALSNLQASDTLLLPNSTAPLHSLKASVALKVSCRIPNLTFKSAQVELRSCYTLSNTSCLQRGPQIWNTSLLGSQHTLS
jgi:hypothetical protein